MKTQALRYGHLRSLSSPLVCTLSASPTSQNPRIPPAHHSAIPHVAHFNTHTHHPFRGSPYAYPQPGSCARACVWSPFERSGLRISSEELHRQTQHKWFSALGRTVQRHICSLYCAPPNPSSDPSVRRSHCVLFTSPSPLHLFICSFESFYCNAYLFRSVRMHLNYSGDHHLFQCNSR